jgi:hypothetical protein
MLQGASPGPATEEYLWDLLCNILHSRNEDALFNIIILFNVDSSRLRQDAEVKGVWLRILDLPLGLVIQQAKWIRPWSLVLYALSDSDFAGMKPARGNVNALTETRLSHQLSWHHRHRRKYSYAHQSTTCSFPEPRDTPTTHQDTKELQKLTGCD